MDLKVMRDLLRKRVGNPTIADVPEDDLTSRINSAYSDITTKFKFHRVRKICLFSTVASQVQYGLPADCFAVLRVRDNTNGKRLTKIGDTEYSDRTETLAQPSTGKPTMYLRQKSWIALAPTPDAVYEMEIFYKAKLDALVADGDVPLIPDAWHEGIVRLARYYHWDDVGDFPKAQAALVVFDKWATEMPTEFDDEAEAIDSGVRLPTLSGFKGRVLDFDSEG